MRATVVLGILVFLAASAVAEAPAQPLPAPELPAETPICQSPAAETRDADPMSPAELVDWAVRQGFEVATRPSASGSENPPSCPPIVSCNATHCVETPACVITDFGSSSCTGHVMLDCPQGTTIKIRRCRCTGGGCQVDNSQTFFCL